MNPEKAREFFSAYYEGSLEDGLKQSFEHRLRTDSQVQAEYRAFERTMDELSHLQFEDIEVPSYLSDRIATRIEHAQTQRQANWLSGLWLRRLGIATVAIVLAVSVVPIAGRWSTGSVGSVLPWVKSTESAKVSKPLTIQVRKGKVVLDYHPSEPRSAVVTEVSTNHTVTYSNGINNVEVLNSNEVPVAFTVQLAGEAMPTMLIVPGTVKQTQATGDGSVEKFASAMSGYYGSPVIVYAKDLGKRVTWDFQNVDATTAATNAGFVSELRADNLISISEK